MKQYLIFSRCPFGFLTTSSLRNYFDTSIHQITDSRLRARSGKDITCPDSEAKMKNKNTRTRPISAKSRGKELECI